MKLSLKTPKLIYTLPTTAKPQKTWPDYLDCGKEFYETMRPSLCHTVVPPQKKGRKEEGYEEREKDRA